MIVAPTLAVARTSASEGPDEAARVRAGVCPATPPEILQFLARDRSVMVRAAVAMNSATPVATATLLARDGDERVRSLIARKLAVLAPGLGPDEQEAVRRQTFAALTALAADEAARVRAALADVLKEMPDAPRGLILALAHDAEETVSDPVIRFSPLLTEQDLLALLAASPAGATAVAVARRPDLTIPVSDVIASTASAGAVRAMLANRSAAIRETTLDALIARAAGHHEWHELLVHRPALSAASVRRLSEIVATDLLEKLARRVDLEPGVLAELAGRLSDRLRLHSLPGPEPARPAGEANAASADAGAVTETVLLHAAQRGEAAVTARLLAEAAQVPLATVERAASLRSAKGLLSLIWKAGFTMRVAGPVQSLLARIAPGALLVAGADGDFPLTRDEMRWQLDFLARMGR